MGVMFAVYPFSYGQNQQQGESTKTGETQKVLVVPKSHNSLKGLIGNDGGVS